MANDKKKVLNERPITQEEKAKALQSAMGQIEKQFGKGSIMRLGENTNLVVETMPSGSLGLDIALGGGLPVGRIIEITALNHPVKQQ